MVGRTDGTADETDGTDGTDGEDGQTGRTGRTERTGRTGRTGRTDGRDGFKQIYLSNIFVPDHVRTMSPTRFRTPYALFNFFIKKKKEYFI